MITFYSSCGPITISNSISNVEIQATLAPQDSEVAFAVFNPARVDECDGVLGRITEQRVRLVKFVENVDERISPSLMEECVRYNIYKFIEKSEPTRHTNEYSMNSLNQQSMEYYSNYAREADLQLFQFNGKYVLTSLDDLVVYVNHEANAIGIDWIRKPIVFTYVNDLLHPEIRDNMLERFS